MVFTPITDPEIEIGKATKKEIFDKTQDNFDDHETRISSVEGDATATFPAGFVIKDSGAVLDGSTFVKVPFDITLTSVVLTVIKAGTAGTLEVDVLSDQGGPFSTVLSGGNLTRAFGAGDFSSVTSVGIATANIDVGKFIRLDVKAVQTEMRDAFVTLTYTVR